MKLDQVWPTSQLRHCTYAWRSDRLVAVADVLVAEAGAEEVDLEAGAELVAALEDRVRAEIDARLLDVRVEVGAFVEAADRCLLGT